MPAIVLALLVLSALICYRLYDKGALSGFHPLKKPTKGSVRVACVGDSITYGFGVRGWAKNNYPAVLARLLGSGSCVNNYGCSGKTVQADGDYPYVREGLFQKSLAFYPDIVILMLGTNDSKPQNWKGVTLFAEGYRNMIHAYRAVGSSPQIFLLSPPPAWSIQGQPLKFDVDAGILSAEIRPAVRKLAEEENLQFIDQYAVFQDRPELFPDGVHPNAAGARAIAETIYMQLQKEEKE